MTNSDKLIPVTVRLPESLVLQAKLLSTASDSTITDILKRGLQTILEEHLETYRAQDSKKSDQLS